MNAFDVANVNCSSLWPKKDRINVGASNQQSTGTSSSGVSSLVSSSLINCVNIETDIKPGEFVLRTLFAEFAVLAEKKIDQVLSCEPLERPLSKSLQRGEDAIFDQLLSAIGSVAEHCLPSLLRILFAWYERQLSATDNILEQRSIKSCSTDSQSKATGKNVSAECDKGEQYYLLEKRDLAVEFIFCLVLIEVLRQLSLHPGHEDLINQIETLAFKHFQFREGTQNDPNIQNINMIADLYAEVMGVLAQTRFQSVRKRFMQELKEWRSKEPSPFVTHSIISLLMGMKFFRIKMAPIEEFEASFQFMQECATYFLEVKDKDIKHALAGLFVEILVPVAASVKNEVNVPCLKNFVEMLYSQTLDLCTKKKHCLALFPLVTCLLCVSQKVFFLTNWHYFLAMCLSHLKNRDPKMCRVALESLYRLLWVYMIRIKCESNTATQSRLHSIVNSLFPKGSKAVVPRDTPLNIFVKIIQFIAQERLDFAMKEIVFDLLSVGRSIKIILTPERMSIGLRAFLVVADSLQQKDGEPPMPRTVGVLPSGNTLRVKKTYLNKMLTEEMARTIGMNHYYSYVRKTFSDILRALDVQFGRPLMMTNMQNMNKEPDDMISGERKPKIDLFRTCVAAIPRLIPDGMSRQDLIDLLARLTVHMDEEMKGLAFQSLQNIIADFADWREDVVEGFIHFFLREINDTLPQLMDNSLRMLLQILTSWKNACQTSNNHNHNNISGKIGKENELPLSKQDHILNVLHNVEAVALTMLCYCRQPVRRLAAHILKETRTLFKQLFPTKEIDESVADAMDRASPSVVELSFPFIPSNEKAAIVSASFNIDLQWLAERNGSSWISGQHDSDTNTNKNTNETIEENKINAWSVCFMALMNEVVKSCPTAVALSWPLICHRLNVLFVYLDPAPVSDNRAAALLRGTTSTAKKIPLDRDFYLELWKNYLMYACRIAPTATSGLSSNSVKFVTQETCASPDSLASERSVESRSPMNRGVSASSLFKQVLPFLRNEQTDLRNAVIFGLAQVNHYALKELIEELVPYIREAIDRKQENVRRRKRREMLRIQLGKLLKLISERNILGKSPCVIDRDAGTLSTIFIEYIDGARLYLETEIDAKDSNSVINEIKLYFCIFTTKLVKSFSLENRSNLLSRELRKNLFHLFASWSGNYGTNNLKSDENEPITDLEFHSLAAMSAVLCCGSVFDSNCISDESNIYGWLKALLSSKEERIRDLGLETIILLLEYNTDTGTLLDWLVDCCYTSDVQIADGCFKALATIFSVREYPCDHYIAIINVTLMNIGCPRASTHELALQLLQILDYRFFGSTTNEILYNPFNENCELNQENDDVEEITFHRFGKDFDGEVQLREKQSTEDKREKKSFEPILSGAFPCSQLDISKRMARLHPQLTMPVFSEITFRFQTAKPPVCQNLLQYLIPWLYNIELVDPNVHSLQPHHFHAVSPEANLENDDFVKGGWGSAEATEMVLNNLFYITVKFGDYFPKEIEDLWAALCASWPNNLRIIIRYLFVLTGLAPNELLPFAKRVVIFMARSKPERLIDEMMTELQTVESLNCLAERTEAPPFFRVTSIRKGSGHSDDDNGVNSESCPSGSVTFEQGTLHTKRHSAAEGINDRFGNKDNSYLSVYPKKGNNGNRNLENILLSLNEDNFNYLSEDLLARATETDLLQKPTTPQPRPLPMPEFGGYYAPLLEYLPNNTQSFMGFHRCNLALLLICDVVIDGVSIDWSPHIPLMLHVIFLGLDHTRSLVHEHCKKLLLNLLIVLSQHNDHLNIARILLNNKTEELGYGITGHPFVPRHLLNFVDPPAFKSLVAPSNGSSRQSSLGRIKNRQFFQATQRDSDMNKNRIEEEHSNENDNCKKDDETKEVYSLQDLIKCLVDFLSLKKGSPLWNYEDITAKIWSIRSADQLEYFLEHILHVFKESMPGARIEERWSEIALQLALSCSSRHYAGRSLQIFRALKIPVNSRMLSDILSRLVETVAEQGEDMQGYVTELMLTLEAAVDTLDSDTRIIGDFVREFFKSTPNLVVKENRRSAPPTTQSTSNYPFSILTLSPVNTAKHLTNHIRSTSYSSSYPDKKLSDLQINENLKDIRNRSNTDFEKSKLNPFTNPFTGNNLGRSRSAQSLKLQDEQYMTPEDKTSLLAQFFWIAVAMLETDYEHEYLLALCLLDKVLSKFQLQKSDCQEKVEKIFSQMKWSQFPGVHSLLLKGCTSPTTYEPTINLLHKLIPLLEIPVIDPSESANSFPHIVMAILPYMLLNYDEPNNLCIKTAESLSLWCTEKSEKLDNLATVMMLYSRRSFTKENLQWTKCVVKYLYDAYSHTYLNLISFLVEIADKGPSLILHHVMSIIHCMLNYIELSSTTTINNDVLKVAAKYIEGPQWKDALKILKLVVTRSSSLVTPPTISAPSYNSSSFNSLISGGSFSADCISIASGASFADSEFSSKRELPGRTMEFTFDLTQTPIVGRKFLIKNSNEMSSNNSSNDKGSSEEKEKESLSASPRRSLSHNHSFNENNCNWRRPWLSQARIRERLIGLLISCGQRVGLPKSPSVIFSQNSDIIDRQSSLASSTEEISATNNDASGDSKLEDGGQAEFALFKDFDFLEYELESQEAESLDNFNWGVRRRSLSNLGDTPDNDFKTDSPLRTAGSLSSMRMRDDFSSDEEGGSVSPLYDNSSDMTLQSSSMFLPNALPLLDPDRHRPSSMLSRSSSHSLGSEGDLTLSNTSASISPHVNQSHNISNDIEEQWSSHVSLLMNDSSGNESAQTHRLLCKIFSEIFKKVIHLTRDCCQLLPHTIEQYRTITCHFLDLVDIFSSQIEFPFIYVDPQLFSTVTQLLSRHRLGVLEVHEHWETFLEKKNYLLECLESLRSAMKIEAMGEILHSECNIEELRTDLCKSLYKMHFQLLLLIESYSKLVSLLASASNNPSVINLSREVTAIKCELNKSIEDTESDRQSTSSSPQLEIGEGPDGHENARSQAEQFLRELTSLHQWSKAIKHLHNMRQYFTDHPLLGATEADDINTILSIYCQQICESQVCYLIITEPEHNLAEISRLLMDTSLQLSSTLHSLDNYSYNLNSQC